MNIYDMNKDYFAMLTTQQILTERIEHIAFSMLDDFENLETETVKRQVKYIHELLKMLRAFETEMGYYFDGLSIEAECLQKTIEKNNYREDW